tara:strand:- start:2449 stop:3624 length:1176 start_codon:yes stop_codon:yes gene_type:complete
MCVAFAPRATADLEDGLIGYWPMDDTTMVPPAGRGFDWATPKTPEVIFGGYASIPEPTMEVDGKVGNALDMSNTPDPINFDGVDIGTGDFTFACWVKNPSGNNFLYQDGGGGQVRLQVQINNFGHGSDCSDGTGWERLAMWIEDGSGGNGGMTSQMGATFGRKLGWIHVAGVIDRDNDANSKFFTDGFSLETTCGNGLAAGAGANLSEATTGQTLHIEGGWGGQIDEFVLYNRALSDAEVEEIFLRGRAGLAVVDSAAGHVSDGVNAGGGAAGADGSDGSDGAAGADGAAGSDGAAGADGAAGPQGPQGKQGPAGQDASCVDCADVESAVFDVVCKVFQGEIAPSSKDAVIECVQSIGVLALLGTEVCDDTDCLGTIMANVDNLIAEKTGE